MTHVPVDEERPRRRRRRAKPLGVFAGTGGFAVNPGMGPLGPVEHARGMKQAGFGWVALNAFDGTVSPEAWHVWTRELDRAGVAWGWWARCYITADVRRLVELTAEHDRRFCIPNCETELVTGHVTVDDLIEDTHAARAAGVEFGLSTESPLYCSVDWKALADAFVILPQCFQNEHPTKTAVGGYEQAKARGVRVNATVGLYQTARSPRLTPTDYRPLPAAWSVYRLDDLHGYGWAT